MAFLLGGVEVNKYSGAVNKPLGGPVHRPTYQEPDAREHLELNREFLLPPFSNPRTQEQIRSRADPAYRPNYRGRISTVTALVVGFLCGATAAVVLAAYGM